MAITVQQDTYTRLTGRWSHGKGYVKLLRAPRNGEAIVYVEKAVGRNGYRAAGGAATLAPGSAYGLLGTDSGEAVIDAAFTAPGTYVLQIGETRYTVRVTPRKKEEQPTRTASTRVYPLNTGLVIETRITGAEQGVPVHYTVRIRDADTGEAKTLEITRHTDRLGLATAKIPATALAPSPHNGPNHLYVEVLVNGKPIWRGKTTVWIHTARNTSRRNRDTRQTTRRNTPWTPPSIPIRIILGTNTEKTIQPQLLIKR